MSGIREWFEGLPLFTKWWFGLSAALPLLGRIGVLSYPAMILTPQFITSFHLWRPFTALFYYPITSGNGFHYLTNLYFLYNYSLRLETGHFVGKPADYLFMLIFNWFSIALICFWMNVGLLMDPMIMSVVYIWCQFNKDTIVTFWFGTQFKAYLLPWVLFGFKLIVGGGGFAELIGIIVGHLYYFVTFTYPETNGGPPLVSTPSILYNYFPSFAGRGGFTGFQGTQQPVRTPRAGFGGGSSWGSGNRLGRE